MANTWHTNMEHFLDVDGLPYIDLPRPAELLMDYFGSITEAVTSRNRHATVTSEIQCRRRPHHRRCSGFIMAVVDKNDPATILWECPICSDRGFLYGWQNTIWDKRRTHNQ